MAPITPGDYLVRFGSPDDSYTQKSHLRSLQKELSHAA
jgi:hypothetical protein